MIFLDLILDCKERFKKKSLEKCGWLKFGTDCNVTAFLFIFSSSDVNNDIKLLK